MNLGKRIAEGFAIDNEYVAPQPEITGPPETPVTVTAWEDGSAIVRDDTALVMVMDHQQS